jgi:opacity protein-like surface antigen
MRTIFVFLLFSTPSWTQLISAGIKAGVPLDRAGQEDNRTTVDNPRWIVGATAEVGIGAHFAIGVDALYRRLGYSQGRNVGSAAFFTDSKTSHWEFPIYAKYRFGREGIRPFLTGGGAFERAHTTGTAGCIGDPQLCGSTGVHDLNSTSSGGGFLVGAGVEFKAGVLKIAPEFRYTRWLRGYFSGAGSDQPALYLGIRF